MFITPVLWAESSYLGRHWVIHVIKWTRAAPSIFVHCKQSKIGQWEGLEIRLIVESMASVFSDCISMTVFQFPHIRLKVGLLLVVSLSKRLACISSSEQQEPIYYVYLKDSCHLLSTYHRCLHKSSLPLEVGDLYWQLKGSVARYELLLLRALKFQMQVQLPHPVSSQCLFMLACWSRVSCAQPSGPSIADTVT